MNLQKIDSYIIDDFLQPSVNAVLKPSQSVFDVASFYFTGTLGLLLVDLAYRSFQKGSFLVWDSIFFILASYIIWSDLKLCKELKAKDTSLINPLRETYKTGRIVGLIFLAVSPIFNLLSGNKITDVIYSFITLSVFYLAMYFMACRDSKAQ